MHVEFFLEVRTEGRVRLDARPTASPRRDTAPAAVLVLVLAAWPCELLFACIRFILLSCIGLTLVALSSQSLQFASPSACHLSGTASEDRRRVGDASGMHRGSHVDRQGGKFLSSLVAQHEVVVRLPCTLLRHVDRVSPHPIRWG